VQETFHDRSTHESSRGIEVSLYLGGTSPLASPPSPSEPLGEGTEPPDTRNLHDIVKSGRWKKMIEALERRACEVRARDGNAAMVGGKGVEGRVFGAGR
jgi:hypothetical protein